MHSYLVDIPGLSDVVASIEGGAAPGDVGHGTVLQALRELPVLERAQLVTAAYVETRPERRVETSQGALVHANHIELLKCESAEVGAKAAFHRLLNRDLRLVRTDTLRLFFTVDWGGEQTNFWQVEVDCLVQRLECKFLHGSAPPDDLDELLRVSTDGKLSSAEQVVMGQHRYELSRVVDIHAFLKVVDDARESRREQARGMTFVLVDAYPHGSGQPENVAYDSLDPDFTCFADRGRRFFQDWSDSSAGRSGLRVCRLRAMDLEDSTAEDGIRYASLSPLGTQRLADPIKLEHEGSVQDLLRSLQAIDRQTGVPFAWYFYLLHRYIVSTDASIRILAAINAGTLALPACDEAVLRRWGESQYRLNRVDF